MQNLSSQNSIFYLLSNNHINDLIVHRFDFSDEELLSYYISFLKTLSFKVNFSTLPFFFNERANDFPLYSESLKFFNHEEDMVRAAVRTLTLNIYGVDDPALRAFIMDRSAVPYFFNLVWFIRDQCIDLDKIVRKCSYLDIGSIRKKTDQLIDHFYYLQDIFNLKTEELSWILTDQFLSHFIFPIIVGSCINDNNLSEETNHIRSHFALFLLTQIFTVFKENSEGLINSLAASLLHPHLSVLAFNLIKSPPQYPVLSAQPISSVIIHASIPSIGSTNDITPIRKKPSRDLNSNSIKSKQFPLDENLKNPRSRTDPVGPFSSPMESISNYESRYHFLFYFILFIGKHLILIVISY